jgi:hypothetical protein
MARSKPLTIGDKHFGTQTQAKDFIQELLNSQPLKAVIPEPHHSFLHALVALHPHAAEKIVAGVEHFTIEPALHGTRCFYLTRVDGTKTDFSTGKCLRGRE